MSNIYEALEQAQREKSGTTVAPAVPLPEVEPQIAPRLVKKPAAKPRTASTSSHFSIDNEMLCLCQNIESLLPDTPEKVIMFVGAQGAEGVSTIVREFARMAATRLNKTVLIMDAAHHNPTQHLHFNVSTGQGWKDVVSVGGPFENACHRTGNPNIHIAPFSPAASHHAYDHAAASGFLDELQKKFDYILVDCSPAMTSPDSLAIARLTHGVVLVMEAERTRPQVIENIRDKVIRNGGKVLGVVFNKRRFHIPDFIYRRL